jgi:signal transduction histidine kinase
MAVATSFSDFVVVRFWQTWWFGTLTAMIALVAVALAVRLVEKTKFQHQLQMAQQEHALERERTRIAQDLHDDLGSQLTRISLLSGLLKADKDNPVLVEVHTNKIAQSADQTVRALEEIVWAVRPGSDSLQSLVEYISHFANELFESGAIRCRLDLPESLPARPLPPDIRHDIFLVVKEALTNALKHSEAAEVRLQAVLTGDTLELLVQDNGLGFKPPGEGADASARQNGLSNMRRRAKNMGGTLTVTSSPGQGASVRLTVVIPNPATAGNLKP